MKFQITLTCTIEADTSIEAQQKAVGQGAEVLNINVRAMPERPVRPQPVAPTPNAKTGT